MVVLVGNAVNMALPSTCVFDYPTASALSGFIVASQVTLLHTRPDKMRRVRTEEACWRTESRMLAMLCDVSEHSCAQCAWDGSGAPVKHAQSLLPCRLRSVSATARAAETRSGAGPRSRRCLPIGACPCQTSSHAGKAWQPLSQLGTKGGTVLDRSPALQVQHLASGWAALPGYC